VSRFMSAPLTSHSVSHFHTRCGSSYPCRIVYFAKANIVSCRRPSAHQVPFWLDHSLSTYTYT
jgi:hypothetical protein